MTWQMMADAAFAVEAGATYFVTNRDLTIPRELGIAPGCGSMIRAVITHRRRTGRLRWQAGSVHVR